MGDLSLRVLGHWAWLAVALLSASTAAGCVVTEPVELPPAPPAVRREDVRVRVDGATIVRLDSKGEVLWSVPASTYPVPAWLRALLPPKPTKEGKPEPGRVTEVGFDGTILTAGADGALMALSPEGEIVFQLGLPSATRTIQALDNGNFEVTADGGGLVTVVSPKGVIVEERAGAASAAPGAPGLATTLAYRAVHATSKGSPLVGVQSVVALGPSDAWALVDLAYRADGHPPGAEAPFEPHLFHYDGSDWTDEGAPKVTLAPIGVHPTIPPQAGTFVPQLLARGPQGALYVIGERRIADYAQKIIVERSGGSFRHKAELGRLFAPYNTQEAQHDATYAASPAGREVFCMGKARCVAFGAGKPPALLDPASEAKAAPALPPPSEELTPLVFHGEQLWVGVGAGAAGGPLWFGADGALLREDGKAFQSVPAPLEWISSVHASADEVWSTSVRGLVRYAGGAFSRVLEVPPPDPARLPWSSLGLAAVDASQLWVFGRSGLWLVTPAATAPAAVRGELVAQPPPAAHSQPVEPPSVDPSLTVQPFTLTVEGGGPARAALELSRASDGALWAYDGARLLEWDGRAPAAKVLYRAPEPPSAACWLSADPEALAQCGVDAVEEGLSSLGVDHAIAARRKGRGALLHRQLFFTFEPAGPTAPRYANARAVTVTEQGEIWVVHHAPTDGSEGPLATVHTQAGAAPVVGLPKAAYVAAAAGPGAGGREVWLAGALQAQPGPDGVSLALGEGVLVHFDGKTFTRHRAPEGGLLAVVAVGPSEAWAVGRQGGLLHVKDGVAKAMRLPSGVALRGAGASGPSDVYFVGDDSTILHWDGKSLRGVGAGAAGPGAMLTSVVAPDAQGVGYVAGPHGMFRLQRKP